MLEGLKTRRIVILNDSCQIMFNLALCVNKIKFKLISTGIEENMKKLISKKEIRFISPIYGN